MLTWHNFAKDSRERGRKDGKKDQCDTIKFYKKRQREEKSPTSKESVTLKRKNNSKQKMCED